MESNKSKIGILVTILVVIFAGVFIGVAVTQNRGANATQLDRAQAAEKVGKMIQKRIVVTTLPEVKSTVDLLNENTLADELPVLKDEDLVVKGRGDIVLEVFASPEKAADSGKNSWLTEVAQRFNKEGFEVDGKKVAISVRNVTSGLGMDYIISGVRIPEIYSPSSMFWGDMCAANGVRLELIDEGIAGNVAGIVISNDKYDEMLEKYGSVTVQTVTQAVKEGVLLFGYTTPNTSSTGLNYVVHSMYSADSKNPLSSTAIESFTEFQANVPFVAQTTMQMQKAAEQGSLDAFVYESQVWENSPTLRSKFKFIPFGVRHDNPVYTPASASEEQKRAVQMFVDYCKTEDSVKLATSCGFNSMNDYVPEIDSFDGDTLIGAQKAWKENKDNGKTIAAVFVADVSGSMRGEPLNMLQTSLINGMQYIGDQHMVGLVTYSTDVQIVVPIGQFNLNQRSLFKGGVESMTADGTTATCDGLLVAIDMLIKQTAETPDVEPMIFLLSDGDSSKGYSYRDIEEILRTLGIPVYTIGYNGGSELMGMLADINEAADIDATSDDVVYKLKNLFNSNL